MSRLELGGLARAIACAIAAFIFFSAGSEMRDLESVSGDSVAEVFYQAMGLFSWGMAALSIALGIPANFAITYLNASAEAPDPDADLRDN